MIFIAHIPTGAPFYGAGTHILWEKKHTKKKHEEH